MSRGNDAVRELSKAHLLSACACVTWTQPMKATSADLQTRAQHKDSGTILCSDTTRRRIMAFGCEVLCTLPELPPPPLVSDTARDSQQFEVLAAQCGCTQLKMKAAVPSKRHC